MGQLSINPIATVPAVASNAPAADDRVQNRAIAAAVARLNDAGYAGADREVTFSVDRSTKMTVIKVIDTNNNEVITQWPPEYLLQLAAENTKTP